MKPIPNLITVLAGFGLMAGTALALSINEAGQPAEFPPEKFDGLQYVDSRGCIYVRTGNSGPVLWVPRVTRSGEVLCGFNPTFAKQAAQSVPLTNSITDAHVLPATEIGLPSGYKPAWDDGRLNPLRGPRNTPNQ